MEARGGAPLYETLESTFPRGLMPEGLEATIKCKVRRRLRDIGYRVMFPEGEPWADVVECFAIASLDRVHRSFGEHPWFWVVAWPGVIGAAAADFWEEIGTPMTRRAVASAATAAHLEALLVKRALGNSDVADALPAPAVLGLRAIGQSTLPALPARALPSQAQLEAAKRLSLESEKGKSAEVWQPPPLPSNSVGPQVPVLPAAAPSSSSSAPVAPVKSVEDIEVCKTSPGASLHKAESVACTECGGLMAAMEKSPEAYGSSLIICDRCHSLCGPKTVQTSKEEVDLFWHCSSCQYDLCRKCILHAESHLIPKLGGS